MGRTTTATAAATSLLWFLFLICVRAWDQSNHDQQREYLFHVVGSDLRRLQQRNDAMTRKFCVPINLCLEWRFFLD